MRTLMEVYQNIYCKQQSKRRDKLCNAANSVGRNASLDWMEDSCLCYLPQLGKRNDLNLTLQR